jgi:hypothetical protein
MVRGRGLYIHHTIAQVSQALSLTQICLGHFLLSLETAALPSSIIALTPDAISYSPV